MATLNESLSVNGTITASRFSGPMTRSNIDSDAGSVIEIPLPGWRIWDNVAANLGATPTSVDDLAYNSGVYGTGIEYLATKDYNAAAAAVVTHYARQRFTLPFNYVTYSSVSIRLCGGMLLAVASVSATVLVEAYVCARSKLVSGSNLVTTAATTINSLTFADIDFALTSSALVPGTVLDLRVQIAAHSVTATSHFGAISHTEAILTLQG